MGASVSSLQDLISSSKLDMNKPIKWEFTGEFVKWDKKDDKWIPVKLKKNEILKFWKKVFRVHKNEIFNISEHRVSKVKVNLIGDRVKVIINYKKLKDSSFINENKLNRKFSLVLQELAVQDFASDKHSYILPKKGISVNNSVSYDSVKNFNSEISQI